MPRNLLLLVVMTVLSATACLEESKPEPRLRTEATLMVDLETVVRVGNVVPVAGVTTAGQPDAAALGIFAEQGYKTVIDIRKIDYRVGRTGACSLRQFQSSRRTVRLTEEPRWCRR